MAKRRTRRTTVKKIDEPESGTYEPKSGTVVFTSESKTVTEGGTIAEVKPKLQTYPPMYKDAGAGIVKFFKVVAARNNKGDCIIRIKSGKVGHKIDLSEKKCASFPDACKKAVDLITEKSKRGYNPK